MPRKIIHILYPLSWNHSMCPGFKSAPGGTKSNSLEQPKELLFPGSSSLSLGALLQAVGDGHKLERELSFR